MSLDITNYEDLAREAVKLFWSNRDAAIARQMSSGSQDTGTRGAVTADKNMDGFLDLARKLVTANGLSTTEICTERRVLTLPGYFRPTKVWDMLVMHQGQLIAALEFKSQVGPSFGNNFNNRSEEVIGTAHDLWTAYREGALGTDTPRPFLGWLMLVEDCEASRSPVVNSEPHFAVLPEFENASYANRYDILCRKLVQEGLYSSAAFLISPQTASNDGTFSDVSRLTSLKTFVTAFAAHIAAVAAR